MPRKRKADFVAGDVHSISAGGDNSNAPNRRSANDAQQSIDTTRSAGNDSTLPGQQPGYLLPETQSMNHQAQFNTMPAQLTNNPLLAPRDSIGVDHTNLISQMYSQARDSRSLMNHVLSHNNSIHESQSSNQLTQNTVLALMQMLASQSQPIQMPNPAAGRQFIQQGSSLSADVLGNIDPLSLLTALQLLNVLQNQGQPTNTYHPPISFLAATHAQDQMNIQSLQRNRPAGNESHQELATGAGVAAVNQSPHPPFTLYMSCDDNTLSEYQCMIRKHIELFAASSEDICTIGQGRNRRVQVGQVGVRCKHCSHIPQLARTKGAVYFPFKTDNVYQACQNMAAVHLCDNCPNIPASVKAELQRLAKEPKSTAGGGKKYWSEGVRAAGIVEDAEGRLRFGDE